MSLLCINQGLPGKQNPHQGYYTEGIKQRELVIKVLEELKD